MALRVMAGTVSERRVAVIRSGSLSGLENGTLPELLTVWTMYLRFIQEHSIHYVLGWEKLWSVDGLLMVCGWLWMICGSSVDSM